MYNDHKHNAYLSQQALKHSWLTGLSATDHDLSASLRKHRVKARISLAVTRISLARRIEALKLEEARAAEAPDESDIPADAGKAADEALGSRDTPVFTMQSRISRAAKADIFRAVVLAKTKEMRQQQETLKLEKSASANIHDRTESDSR